MRFSALVPFILLFPLAYADPLVRDLGKGLAYYRVHALPADLPLVAVTDKRACVLDLRNATGDAKAAEALEAWLKFHATPHTPVFVLANAGTQSALLGPLAVREPAASVLLLGPEAPGFFPDLAIKISAPDDRRAYDALETGSPIESLLTENPDKPRNDEARLAKEHLPDSAAADNFTDEDFEPTTEKTAPAKPTQVIDSVLQRAMHVHRALLALKKL